MKCLSIISLFCAALSFLDQTIAGPAKNAHDIIMEVNAAEVEKRTSNDVTAEDKIVEKNKALGVDLFEGDIKISKEEREKYYGNGNRKRNVILDRRSSWRTRVIPYVIDHYGTSQISSADAAKKIVDAMNVIKSKVPCLVFRPRQASDAHYIRFYKGVGCWSYIGRRFFSPNTDVSLGEGCFAQSVIIHEIMHALGFFHEQSRPDRDSFVTIMYENIQSAQLSNFERMKSNQALIQNTPYDYESIMHYSRTTFTSNGKDTLRAKFDPAKNLGGTKMSDLDILELNKVYQCHLGLSAGWSEWTAWTVCLSYGSSCKRIRQRYCFSDNTAHCPGADSYGVEEQTEACTSCLEPMNGHWNNWGSWSSCSQNCDQGIKTRNRACNNPVPSNGGKDCIGSNSETVICRIKKCNQKWYDTSFEDGWGMWKQSSTDSGLNWIRRSGPTPSEHTGPNGDHTTTYGYYAYIEAGSLDHRKKVTLQSAEFPANFGDKCLKFYYNMNGKSMGSLAVILKYKSGSSMWVWDKAGHQGNYWKAASAYIPNSNEPYTIEIEGKIGIAPESDIAIDDVFIDDGKCPTNSLTCQDTNTNCAFWAKIGECHKNPGYMMTSCCISCTDRITECTSDKYGSTACSTYAKDYGCTHNGEWMWENCCKSCKDCLDIDSTHCPIWQKAGECEINPTWMKANCKISCKVCKP